MRPAHIPRDMACSRMAALDASEVMALSTLQAVRSTLHWHGLSGMQPGPNLGSPLSLAAGDAGLALAFGAVADIDSDDWRSVAHTFVNRAVRWAEATWEVAPLGLFSGLTGLAFAIRLLSRGGALYSRAVATIDDMLSSRFRDLYLPPFGASVEIRQFDVINGAAGIAAYVLLAVSSEAHVSREFWTVIDWLITRGRAAGGTGFYTSLESSQRYDTRRHTGGINAGMAHGAPGALALLAIAKLNNIHRPGLDEAVRSLMYWVMDTLFVDEACVHMPWWSAEDTTFTPARLAWCYGIPGVSRALWLAGRALGRSDVQTCALEAFLSATASQTTTLANFTPTICHGLAGLLQIAKRFHSDTKDPRLSGLIEQLTCAIISAYDSTSPFRFRDSNNGEQKDVPGILSGAAGVALTLMPLSADFPWDRMLLLG